jgi:hypothetical protein
VQLISSLSRIFLPVPVDGETSRQRVYRLKEAGEVKDPWRRRIVELSDGKTVGEIAEALYQEELERGAGIVDIGLWRTGFYRSAVETIWELGRQGFICVKANEGVSEGEAAPGAEEREPDLSPPERAPSLVLSSVDAPRAGGTTAGETVAV